MPLKNRVGRSKSKINGRGTIRLGQWTADARREMEARIVTVSGSCRIKQTVRLWPGLRLYDSQVELVEEMLDEKVVRTEHLHRAFLLRMVAKEAFQICPDVAAVPFLFEHGAGLHDVHRPIGLDQEIGHGLAEGLADDEAFAARFAQCEIACERELFSSGSENRAVCHERIRGEMGFECASNTLGFVSRATGDQHSGKRGKDGETAARKHSSSTDHGPRPTAFLITETSTGLF